MPVSILKKVVVRLSGPPWDGRELTINDSDMCVVEGRKFYILTPYNVELVQAVVRGASSAPTVLGKFSLTRAVGFQRLLLLRNEAAWPNTPDPAQSLFAEAAQQPQRKRRRIVGGSHVLKISLPAYDDVSTFEFDMKCPRHPRDRLCIPLEPEAMERVFLFIRAFGFEDPVLRPTRPDGIPVGSRWNKQRATWLVPIQQPDGQAMYKTWRLQQDAAAPMSSLAASGEESASDSP